MVNRETNDKWKIDKTNFMTRLRGETDTEWIWYWWYDMRPREIRELIKQVYEKAYTQGYIKGTYMANKLSR